LVTENASMQDAVLEMTKKRLGTVAVVNTAGGLAGIITDGDLRRHMSATMMTDTAAKVMTMNPKTIEAAQLAVEAVALMQEKSITKLVVLENNKPVGLLDIHDCLKAGIA
jgi:arabinose-5-phosphate isomerase